LSEEQKKCFQFLIYRQKYIELLEEKNIKQALNVLRNELKPNTNDSHQLHKLSSLIMCNNLEDLKKRSKYTNRQELLIDLQEYISPSLMIPEDRLETLLLRSIDSNSLLEEEISPLKLVPKDVFKVLKNHTDEVWNLEFSHDGKYLASCSADKTVLIYQTSDFDSPPIVCNSHQDVVSMVKWSFDNSMLLSCSNDNTIILWRRNNGEMMKCYTGHKDKISSISWFPDNLHFVSGGGGNDKTIKIWDIHSNNPMEHKINYKIQDLQVSPDGKKLIVISHNKKIHIYNPSKMDQCYTLFENDSITSLFVSKCSQFLLCTLAKEDDVGYISMWDLNENKQIKNFKGHKQSKFVLRCCFGGKNNMFVASGSEDYRVFIWDQKNNILLAELVGHEGIVNSISWNPIKTDIFASASDDGTIRIWKLIVREKEL
jgi:WD repeat-containing protein 26